MTSSRGPHYFAALVVLVGCLACSDDDPPAEEEGNVEFSTMCSIGDPCGGDPSGEWRVESGCVQPSDEDYDCDWRETASGVLSGTVSFQGGSASIELEAQINHCGTIDLSSTNTSGTYTVMGNELVTGATTFAFCAEGDTLRLWESGAQSPFPSVLELSRTGS
ncbi:MAG TPA: hypothetical protein VFZ53_23500 [Polyangiaceae bacterium]